MPLTKSLNRQSTFRVLLLAALSLTVADTAPVCAQTRRPAVPRPAAPRSAAPRLAPALPTDALLTLLLAAEDTRSLNADVLLALENRAPAVRTRAALAAGRIGDVRAVANLSLRLRQDADDRVRQMSAFALGEIESAASADALLEALRADRSLAVRARVVEALGKIAAALPDGNEIRRAAIGDAILGVLDLPVAAAARNNFAGTSAPLRSASQARDTELTLFALTATLRARPANAGASIARHLASADANIRATALNTLARLRLSDANDRARLLLNDADSVVRANAARVLGAGGDRAAIDSLIQRMKSDADERVRVSAVRALAMLKGTRATANLRERFKTLLDSHRNAPAARANSTSGVVVNADSTTTDAAATTTDAAANSVADDPAAAANTILRPAQQGELLEVASALGAALAGTSDEPASEMLRSVRNAERLRATEIEIALARIAPAAYPRDAFVISVTATPASHSWQSAAAVADGLSEVARTTFTVDNTGGNSGVLLRADVLIQLRQMIDAPGLPVLARPNVLRAFAAAEANDLPATLTAELANSDVFTRATAAELLGEFIATEATPLAARDAATEALTKALLPALDDADPDAALAILAALTQAPIIAIEPALAAKNYLVRQRAATILQQRTASTNESAANSEATNSNATSSNDASNGATNNNSTNNNSAGGNGAPVNTVNLYAARVGSVASRYAAIDYARAVARARKRVRATVETERGAFTLELLPADAPLTVDNFITLAERKFFDNVTFHRVVPNFVAQTGDQRGDGNGSPGYQIRCEINTVPYERGAVGMALSGKDTGGSQWFVTHSPQPHLDGGYTVFARVVSGLEVVDRLTRGDRIRTVRIAESASPAVRQPAPGRARSRTK